MNWVEFHEIGSDYFLWGMVAMAALETLILVLARLFFGGRK